MSPVKFISSDSCTGLTFNMEYFFLSNLHQIAPPNNSVTVFLCQKIKILLPSVHRNLTSYLVHYVRCIFNLVATFIWIKQLNAKSCQQ